MRLMITVCTDLAVHFPLHSTLNIFAGGTAAAVAAAAFAVEVAGHSIGLDLVARTGWAAMAFAVEDLAHRSIAAAAAAVGIAEPHDIGVAAGPGSHHRPSVRHTALDSGHCMTAVAHVADVE